MTNTIPTAEEYCMKHQNSNHPNMIYQLMTEFAKLHVQAALKEAREKYTHDELYVSDSPEFLK